MKYIDAEKLIAEIERLKSVLTNPLCSQGNILGPDWVAGGNKMLNEISSAISALQQEQPEVDLVAEYDEQFDSDTVYGKLINRNAGIVVARHFWNKGYNARKK